jgi:hypothetical protein
MDWFVGLCRNDPEARTGVLVARPRGRARNGNPPVRTAGFRLPFGARGTSALTILHSALGSGAARHAAPFGLLGLFPKSLLANADEASNSSVATKNFSSSCLTSGRSPWTLCNSRSRCEFSGTATTRSLRMRSSLQRITRPGHVAASWMTRASSGSPSSARVEGINPSRKGRTARAAGASKERTS